MRCVIGLIYNFTRKLGFTQSEIRVIFYLIFFLIIGGVFNYYLRTHGNKALLYNYKQDDSLFLNNIELDDLVNEPKIIENNVDIKQELLDFRKAKIRVNKNNAAESEFVSVNINNAGIDELIKLPGIGLKTAEAIVQYRNKYGKFNSIEDLLKVKGIGISKLETIKDKIIVKKEDLSEE